jgi:hypothetical protein
VRSYIERWNGANWTVYPSPSVGTPSGLWGVDVVGPNDAWAVGDYFDGLSQDTLILHWDGSVWTQVPSPSFGHLSWLYDVAAVSSNDVWAVGAYLAGTAATDMLILHWNGINWSVIPGPIGPTWDSLQSVDALSATDIWAVGHTNFFISPLTIHWDGAAWTWVHTPDVAGGGVLSGVSALASDNIWAVGYGYGQSSALIMHYGYGPCLTATPTSIPMPTSTPTLPTTPTMQPTACTLTFSDVPIGSTFYSFIRCLACRGIVSGYSTGCETGPCFRPNNNVTRGQLSKIVSNSAGFNDPPGGEQLFEDVVSGSTFYTYTQRLAVRGLINGYPCGGPGEPCVPPDNLPYFRTYNNSTRGQLSKIVSNAAGFGGQPGPQIFEDVPPGSVFYTYTQMLGSRGVIQGYPCGGPGEPCVPPNNRPYFRTYNNSTRGQTAKIVANTFFPDCQTPLRR